jgi:cell division protein FtsB
MEPPMMTARRLRRKKALSVRLIVIKRHTTVLARHGGHDQILRFKQLLTQVKLRRADGRQISPVTVRFTRLLVERFQFYFSTY